MGCASGSQISPATALNADAAAQSLLWRLHMALRITKQSFSFISTKSHVFCHRCVNVLS